MVCAAAQRKEAKQAIFVDYQPGMAFTLEAGDEKEGRWASESVLKKPHVAGIRLRIHQRTGWQEVCGPTYLKRFHSPDHFFRDARTTPSSVAHRRSCERISAFSEASGRCHSSWVRVPRGIKEKRRLFNCEALQRKLASKKRRDCKCGKVFRKLVTCRKKI